MRRFSFGPPLSPQGRQRRGLRGLSGKPSHPPLTDVPITAYLFTAVFDVLSVILHSSHTQLGEQFYRAGTWVLLGGAAVSLLTALTGLLDWMTLPSGTEVWRTANAHAITMVTVTVLVLVNLVLRLTAYHTEDHAKLVTMILSVVAALLVVLGASIGGSLVYDHGVNVEAATGSTLGRVPEPGPHPDGPAGGLSP